MARPRVHNEAEILERAMHAFRRKGFAETSVKDLEKATGATSGSLYNAFDGKRGLFDAAFEHYLTAVLKGRIERHAPPGSGLRGLRDLFTTLLFEPDQQSFGCLVTNSAIEFGEEQNHRSVQHGFDILFETFRSRLSELNYSNNSEIAATKLLTFYQGILVLFRGGYDRSRLEAAIDAEFNQLGDLHDA